MDRSSCFLTTLFSISILLFSFALNAQDGNIKKMLVIIDPGHGGSDTGAIGRNGIREKEVVLEVAQLILDQNKKILSGKYEIYLTRYGDTLVSLGDRTKLARSLKPDLFVSLHCNHASNPRAKGVEAFVWKPVYARATSKMKGSVSLAYSIARDFEYMGFKNRGVKFANFQVLRETNGFCPSILLEMGFLSNRDEAAYAKTMNGKNALAWIILSSIQKYFGI